MTALSIALRSKNDCSVVSDMPPLRHDLHYFSYKRYQG